MEPHSSQRAFPRRKLDALWPGPLYRLYGAQHGFCRPHVQCAAAAVQSGTQIWGGLNLWILACWLAAFTNLSLDVYLEGPQGGVWFWSVIGLGIAALRIQAYEARQLQRQSRTRDSDALIAGYANA